MKEKERNSVYFVYTFMKDCEILYVGRTHDIWTRFNSHQNSDFYKIHDEIRYATFGSITDAMIAEIYLIDRNKPRYNSQYNYSSVGELKIDLPEFKVVSRENLNPTDKSGLNFFEKKERISEEKKFLLENGFTKKIGARNQRVYTKGDVCISANGFLAKRYIIKKCNDEYMRFYHEEKSAEDAYIYYRDEMLTEFYKED